MSQEISPNQRRAQICECMENVGGCEFCMTRDFCEMLANEQALLQRIQLHSPYVKDELG